jgi:hypothetical protein
MAFSSDTSLRLAGWWVQNRGKFREWRTVLFLGAVFVLLVLDGISVGLLAIGDRPLSVALGLRAGRLAEAVAAETPQPLTVTAPALLPGSANRVDLLAWIHNPNPTWLAKTVAVHFTVAGTAAPALSTFVLPDGDRLLLENGVSLPAGAVQVIVDDVEWQRIGAHDPSLGSAPFLVQSAVLTPTTLSSGTPGTTATVKLKNQSVYGYRQLDVTVSVERSGVALAAGRTSAVNVRSGSAITLTVTWAQSFPADAKVRVDPVANPFNADNRLSPGA